MACVDTLNISPLSKRFRQTVQHVSNDPLDPFHPCREQEFGQDV